MKVSPKLQEIIDAAVTAARVEKEPSGRLSASRLGWPTQWQMLHYFKVPQEPVDEYTLRKFQRGKDVEDRIVQWVKPQSTQVPVEYRGVVGFVDMVLDYPIEIKSVTNMAFKHIQKDGVKRGHKLQGELYAKALGFDTFGIAYVASDDYRVLCLEETVSGEVDSVIDEYESCVSVGKVPTFSAKEAWQGKKEYNAYSEWMELTEEQIAAKLKELGK